MRFLKTLLEWCPTNVNEMKQIGGYDIVAKLMRRKEWILDEEMLSVVFDFCGIRRSPKQQVIDCVLVFL